DLVAWLVADQQLSLRAWLRDGDAMIPGPRHDLAALTGQPRVEVVDARGVGDAAGDGIADVLVVQGEILARIRGLDGDVPVVIAQALPGVVAWAGAGRLHAHDLD